MKMANLVALQLLLLTRMTTLEYNIECPHPSQRRFRARVFCNGTQASWYSCLYNVHRSNYVEDCNSKPDFVRKGERYVLIGSRSNKPCSEDRYQPFRFWSNTCTLCSLKKSPCSEIGQMIYANGSTKRDATCRCDHNKDYGFLSRTRHLCFCSQSEEDCTCYKKKCPNGQKLNSDYVCRNKTSINDTRCKISDANNQELNYTKIDQTTFPTGIRGDTFYVVAVFVTVVVLIICLLAILINQAERISEVVFRRWPKREISTDLVQVIDDLSSISNMNKDSLMVCADCGVMNSDRPSTSQRRNDGIDREDKQRYFIVASVYIELITLLIKQKLETVFKILNFECLEDFLKHEPVIHTLFHLRHRNTWCCKDQSNCTNQEELPVTHYYWKQLYAENPRPDTHNCFCKYTAKSVKLEDLDLSLCGLILYNCCNLEQLDREAIHILTRNKSDYLSHNTTCGITKDEYGPLMDELKTNILQLNQTKEDELNRIQNESMNDALFDTYTRILHGLNEIPEKIYRTDVVHIAPHEGIKPELEWSCEEMYDTNNC